MGDRAVIGFQSEADSPVLYLYMHWSGSEQEQILKDALLRSSSRWGDNSYATRICISELVGKDWNQDLGYGLEIDSYASPDYDTIQVVCWYNRTVELRNAERESDVIAVETFDEFILSGFSKVRVKEELDKS